MENKKCCANCIYGRLICNTEQWDKLVGCSRHNLMGLLESEKDLVEYLNRVGYKPVSKNEILSGWIYSRLPFGSNRESYDTVDSGVITNGCLICNLEDCCDEFVEK
jgi:hypothetical protein